MQSHLAAMQQGFRQIRPILSGRMPRLPPERFTVSPYPTDYNECTEVAREELDNGVGSVHLQGFGTTGRNTTGVEEWLRIIRIIP